MPDFVRARCRLIPDFWIVAAVSLAMLLLLAFMAAMQPPRGFEGWLAGAAMFVLCGATPFYWLLARRRGCIELDENGARWRTAFGAWKSARWGEIESCDARMASTGGKIAHWKFVVQTRRGAFSWTNSFENADELTPFAARFCAQIPTNAEDWPRRFGYRSSETAWIALGCLFLIVMFVGALAKPLIGASWRDVAAQIEIYFALYGWLLTLAGFALFGVIVVTFPALFLFFYFVIARQSWKRRDEIFVATPRGLSWQISGRERLFARFDELQTLHVETRGPLISLPFYRLQSARGEFNWNSGLCGATQLDRTLFERAPQLQREVQTRLREELSQAPDESSEIAIFDFETRTLRALLWSGAFIGAITWGAVIFGPFEPPENGEPMPTWASFIFAVIITAATIYCALLFRRGCIVLNQRGIEWRSPFRQQFVAWDEIDGLLADKKYYLQVGARRVPLAIHDIYPARSDLLVETIARRTGGAWKSAGETARAQDVE